MTVAVEKELLDSFNSLWDVEKHEATVEILKSSESALITDSSLSEIADDLFRVLDQSELENAKP